MRFPLYFKRGKGTQVSATVPVLGSATDPAPTVTSGRKAGADVPCLDNRGATINRLAIGYWYEGGGSAVTLPVSAWLFDEESQKYYLAGSGTLTNGQITYLKLPNVPPPPQASSGMPNPGQGMNVLIVIADNSQPTDSVSHFVAGFDQAMF